MTATSDCHDDHRHGNVIDAGSRSRHSQTTESNVGGPNDRLLNDDVWSVDRSHDSVANSQQQQQQQQQQDWFQQLPHCVEGGFEPDQQLYDFRICNQTVSGFEEYPDSHNCVIAYSIQFDKLWTPMNPIVYGFVHPIVVAATLVTNCLVCAVLLRRTMRTPTSILLIAMAVSDALTSLLPTPCFIAFFTLGLSNDWVPYRWCLPYLLFTDHLPTVFHTASVWLTVALAAQRYVHVCHSSAAKRLCTVGNMLRVIAVVYAAAFAAQIPRMIEMKVFRVLVPSQLDPSGSTWFDGCHIEFIPIVLENMHLYFGLYYWFRVVFTHLIPCTSLIVLNAVLAHTMSVARRRRSQLLSTSRRAAAAAAANAAASAGNNGAGTEHRRQRSEYRRIGDGIATTLMLVVVVGLLLAVELPLACFLILMTLENTWGSALIPEEVTGYAGLLINLLIVCSYPVNFFIYCGMSRQFRQAFSAMFSSTDRDAGRPEVGHRPDGGVGDTGRGICASGGGLRVPAVGYGRSTGGGDAPISADDGGSRLGGSPCSSSAPRAVSRRPMGRRRASSSLFARLQRRTAAPAQPQESENAMPVVLLTAADVSDESKSLRMQCVSLLDSGTPSSQNTRCHDNEYAGGSGDATVDGQRTETDEIQVECSNV